MLPKHIISPLTLLVPILVPVVSADADCGIYPSCAQYGEGTWEILEDCHRYIECVKDPDSKDLIQHNLECPGDLVYANEYGKCVEWDLATQCKLFQSTPCLLSCPRVYISSTGPALQYREEGLGCYRISGTLFGGTLVHYQNDELQYLTPGSTQNPMQFSWIVSETPGGLVGTIKNTIYEYLQCPFDGWYDGWEVEVGEDGEGDFIVDETIRVTCHKGDDGASTDVPPVTTTTPTTQPADRCHKEGPNAMAECVPDFLCCQFDTSTSTWQEHICTCSNGNVFMQEFEFCTWEELCGVEMLGGSQDKNPDYNCQGIDTCPGY